MKRFIGFMLVAVACAVIPARAQDYPNKQIVMVVPFAAGGPTDTLARNLGVTLTNLLKQQVIIDNAGGAICAAPARLRGGPARATSHRPRASRCRKVPPR